jgi:dihydrodiol dehydrogenase / D-xylose 1-dehydrogenase (NADP)
MEGMWTRCFPAVRKAREWMAQGKIGRTLGVHAYFGIKTVEEDWQPWKAGLAHAGGALRDVGIYSLAMAQMGFGESPQKICSTYVTNGEVDIHADLMLQYSDCRTAFLTAAFDTVTEHEAVIIGEKGQIVIGEKFWRPSKAELYTEGASIFGNRLEETFEEPYEATGFQYEIRRVQECLRRGLTECPDFTWDDSMEICRMIDGLRKDWGIAYASDSCGM